MSMDAKGIRLLLWRIIRFSGNCCYKFVRKYPLVSGVLSFVFFLYIIFPSVFYFLMYSSPILVCTVVSIRFYLKTKYPEYFQWLKKQDSERPSANVNRSNDPSLRPQKSVRRNARKEVVIWDRKDSEDRNMFFPTSHYDSLFSKTNFLEENPKSIFEGKGNSSMEHGESSSHNDAGNDRAVDDPSSTSKRHSVSGDSFQGQSGKGPDGGGVEVEVESLEEGEDEDEEEVQEEGNKAVEWTDDDQKNLMDLGFSELERNKRLESLIAKRRARKLLKMAVEKTLMDRDGNPLSQIAPILTVKNNLLGVSNPNEEGLQMPGSAPSILLPAKNPFDLPYDPLEEKPNLMADSFHQEFMAANQKEMLLCRHESFCHGPLFTLETTQDPRDAQFNPDWSTEKRPGEGRAVSRFKRQSEKEGLHQHNSSGVGSNTDLVELEDSNHNEAINSSEVRHAETVESANNRIGIGGKVKNPHDLEPGLDRGSVVRMETDSIKNNDSGYSSSSEANDELILDQTSKPSQIFSDHVQKTLNLSIPPRGKTVSRLPYDSSPSPSEKRRTDISLFLANRRYGHTPTCSIASDLQVEVSEVGSPPLTSDGTVSSVDGDSVTYDGDVDRDINSDSEELWGGSFNLSRSEANRVKLRELHDISEENSVEVELSGLNRKPEEPIVSPSPSEQEAKQNLNNTSSVSSRIDISENGPSHPTNRNRETPEDVKQIHEEVEGFKTFNVSKTLSPENPGKTMPLMEKSVVHSPSESCFEKPEQFIEPPTEDFNIIRRMKPVTHGDVYTLDLKPSENRDNEAQILIKPAAVGEVRQPAKEINLDSSEFRQGNLETSYESKNTMETGKEKEESQPSKYIEEDTRNLTEHNTGDAPNIVQNRDDLNSVPDGIDDQNVTEDNVSGVKQGFGGSIAMALNPRLVMEQFSVSSVSSPRSVLPQNILADQIPISIVEQRIQTDVPQSAMEDIVRDSSADDQPHENLTFNMPQNAQQVVENSIDHSSSNCSLETLEGSSNTTQKTTNYSTVHNMNELVLEDMHGKEDSIEHNIKSSEGESETMMSSKDTKELSGPFRESDPGSVEHLEGGSEKLIEYDTGISPSNVNSDVPETMIRSEEEPTNSPWKVIKEGNIVENINDSVVNEKVDGEKSTTSEGESQFSIRLEAVKGPEESNEHEADVNKKKAHESDNTSIPETATQGEKSAAEVDSIGEVNDSLADNITNKEILNHVLDGEGEPQILSRREAVMEPSNTTEATSAGTVEDTEHESKRLTDAEANAGISTSAEESDSLNNIKNGDSPKLGEDDLNDIENIPAAGDITTGIPIDHEIAMEASKATESEVKAVNPEENDSNAVAN
ncbi:hypothetical protein QQP08_027858 [Theobroma cacao]|nr:hypothetical protein QQP08_027425 [Theobroma cacao]WRX35371.1 hypothetical protein QQP08_027858 [Theobroma cacao]